MAFKGTFSPSVFKGPFNPGGASLRAGVINISRKGVDMARFSLLGSAFKKCSFCLFSTGRHLNPHFRYSNTMETPAQLEALVQLLQESQPPKASATLVSSSQGPVEPQAGAQTGSVIRSFGEVVGASSSTAPVPSPAAHDPQSIWKEEEVLPLHEALSAPDGRKRPEFDFGYKQRVGSEDVFLGLSGTTESSIHCDTLVMRISLPGERLQDVELDCTDTRILVSAAHL